MNLSKNFTLQEMIESQMAREHGIQEQWSPPDTVINNLRSLCIFVLQPLRDYLDHPIHVSSGWRCIRLNKLVGGVWDRDAIQELHLPFDQLINEFSMAWVHVSHRIDRLNRGQVLTIR
jgi:hypothetical protein